MEDKRRHIYIDDSEEFYVKQKEKEKKRFQKIFRDSCNISKKASKDLEKILGKPITEIFPYKFNKKLEELKKIYDIKE